MKMNCFARNPHFDGSSIELDANFILFSKTSQEFATIPRRIPFASKFFEIFGRIDERRLPFGSESKFVEPSKNSELRDAIDSIKEELSFAFSKSKPPSMLLSSSQPIPALFLE